MSTNKEWNGRLSNAVSKAVSNANSIFADKARNAQLWDIEGNRYIDFGGGIGALNTGHCNDKVISAVKDQLDKFTHTAYAITPYPQYVKLAEKLNQLVPGDFAKKSLFVTTGAEAVENAIKIARIATKRLVVISFIGGFHGRTMLTLGLTGKIKPYKVGLSNFTNDIFHVPFPKNKETFSEMQHYFENLFKADIAPEDIAAIIFEPVQGEGGFYSIYPEAIKWIRDLCDKYQIVMIADEIQSGFARTGKFFAIENFNIAADIVTSAKSLAGGFTLAAVTGKAAIMDSPIPGSLGGTYAGNPVAIAAALATIEIMEQENLPQRASKIGECIENTINKIKARVPQIKEFRRLGAMAAIEFYNPTTKEINTEIVSKIQQLAINDGLIILSCGYGNVIRFLVPLTIEDDILQEGLNILEKSILSASNS
jgi:4-aminobutyrate aminotransferase